MLYSSLSKKIALMATTALLVSACGDGVRNYNDRKVSVFGTVYSGISNKGERSLVKNLDIRTVDVLLNHANGAVISQNLLVSRESGLRTDEKGTFLLETLVGGLNYEEIERVCNDVCIEREKKVECVTDSNGNRDCYDAGSRCVVYAEQCEDELRVRNASFSNIESGQVQLTYNISGAMGASISNIVNSFNENNGLVSSTEKSRHYLETLKLDVDFKTDVPFGYDGNVMTQGQALTNGKPNALKSFNVLRIKATPTETVTMQIERLMREGTLSAEAMNRYELGQEALRDIYSL
jgi:hypothetical protein